MEDFYNAEDRQNVSSLLKGLIRCLSNSYYIHQNLPLV